MTYEDFIIWVQQELTRRGWSQAELARRGGITQSHLSRLLSGERPPGASTARALARAFNVPLEEVFRRAGILPDIYKPAEGVAELLDAYLQLDPANRRRLIRIAAALQEEDIAPEGK